MKNNEPIDAAPEPASVQENPGDLTSGRLLAGNTLWNMAGLGAPALIGILCLPFLKRYLGNDRLGLITLAWGVIGYFSVFDFGLSRALTMLLAERLGQRKSEEIQPLVSTCMLMLVLLGGIGALIACVLSPRLIQHLTLPADLRHESLYSLYWLSVSLPLVILATGARAVLEAMQKFRLTTAIRIPLGIFTYLGPVLVLPFSRSTVAIIAVLVLGRAIACCAYIWACVRVLPQLWRAPSLSKPLGKLLFRFGGWMTVSNVVAPFLVTFDRFVIAAVISVAAVAYYAVPFEVVLKLTLVPGALMTVLFPAFSTAGSADRGRLVFLYESGVKYIFVGLFPVTLVLIAFAPEALSVWLGRDFALHSTSVARWLLAAIFLNGLAQIPFIHLQSEGRPDITAKLHILELPIYAAVLFNLTKHFGIDGAAIAWLLRIVLDGVLLFWFSHRLLRENKVVVTKLPRMLAAGLTAFIIAAWTGSVAIRVVIVCGSTLLAGVLSWSWMFTASERKSLLSLLQWRGAQSG
ncbi:MAG TPA: flippase [Candidatus Angelobacter sp.]|nr:flippase [Candidatus Angelobacter sp.]